MNTDVSCVRYEWNHVTIVEDLVLLEYENHHMELSLSGYVR